MKKASPPEQDVRETSAGWLADHWLAWLEDDDDLRQKYRGQIRRGRNLARKGVRDLRILPGVIKGDVLADTGEVHSVTIRMDLIDRPAWEGLLDAVSEEAALASEILQGRVSKRIVEMFEEVSLGLFPFDIRDIKNYCSCSEEGLVCTGSVAVHLHFADVIQADPMKLLQFRGREREHLIRDVRERRNKRNGETEEVAKPTDNEDSLFERGSALAANYWSNGPLPTLHFQIADVGPMAHDALLPTLRALGKAPSDTDVEDLITALEPLVKAARYRIDLLFEAAEREADIDASIADLHAAEIIARAEAAKVEVRVEETAHPVVPDAAEEDESLDDMIVSAASQRGSLTTQFVAEALDVHQKDAREYLQYLVSQGRLMVSGKGRGTRYLPVAEGS